LKEPLNIIACRFGVYGYGGATPSELVRFRYECLACCPKRALLYYANGHKGFGPTKSQVEKHYIRDEAMELKGGMQQRPVDVLRKRGRPLEPVSRAVERDSRFKRQAGHDVWGWVVAADSTGGFSPTAYDGYSTSHVFVDCSRPGGYLFLLFTKTGTQEVSAKAVNAMVSHWQRHGHHKEPAEWKMPVAELRSDSGGFSSQAVESICEGFRIIQKFSAPNTQSQNPAEAYIKQLFRKVTIFFAAASWMPRFLWNFALQHAALCLNLTLHPDSNTPSWESFRGETYDFWANPLLPWGHPVEVFVPKDQREWKFGERCITCFFVGVPIGVKQAIMVFNPVTGKVRVTRDYRVSITGMTAKPEWPLYRGTGRLANDFIPHTADADVVVNIPDTDMVTDINNPPTIDRDLGVFLEEVNECQEPIVPPIQDACVPEEVEIPQTPADSMTATLLPEIEGNVVNDDSSVRDVIEPLKLNMDDYDEVFVASIGFDGKLCDGAQLAYVLLPEEVGDEKPPLTEDSKPGDPEVVCNRLKLKNAIAKLRDKRKRLTDLQRRSRIRQQDVGNPRAERRVQAAIAAHINKAQMKLRKDDNPTLAKAMKGPYRQMVIDAVDAELTQYIETYEALELIDGDEQLKMSKEELARALTSHFEITYKRDKDTGKLLAVKARLCIHGNQINKYDFDDVKSPTARSASMKLLLAILGKKMPNGERYKGRTWDITGAFLRVNIDQRTAAKLEKDPAYVAPRPILLRLPDGRIGRLTAYVYGLKQASLEFREVVDGMLTSNGYIATADPCVYVRCVGDDKIMVTCHVDDFLAVSSSDVLLDQFDAMLAKQFGDDDLKRKAGDDLVYMGLVIKRMSNGDIFVSQPAYYKKLWKDYAELLGLHESDIPTTGDPVIFPMHHQMKVEPDDDVEVDSTKYRAVIGALNHLAIMTRPDISLAMSLLASKCSCPTMRDIRQIRVLFRYVMRTQHIGLNFKHDSDFRLIGWADASFATRTKYMSQSGYGFTLGFDNATFYTRSSKQQLVTMSSTEAEYVALFHASCEAVWLKRLLTQLGFHQSVVTIFQDNLSTIQWCHGKEDFHRSKHIAIKYHKIREWVIAKEIVPTYMSTKEMIADVLTKPIVNAQFEYLACGLLGISSFKQRIPGTNF
jgi:hypothetical protein